MSSSPPNIKQRQNMGRKASVAPKKKKKKKKIFASLDENDLCRHYVSSVDKQLLFQDIIKQFGEWPSWQKRLLLCRFSEKTSSSLLSTLSTVLEPIFHRDFEIKSKKGFDSALIKTFLDSTPFVNLNSISTLSPFLESTSQYSGLSAANSNEDTDEQSRHYLSPAGSRICVSPLTMEKINSRGSVSSNPTASSTTINISSKNSSRFARLQKRRSSCMPTLNTGISISISTETLHQQRVGRGKTHTHLIKRNSDSMTTEEFLTIQQMKDKKKLGDLVKPSLSKNLGSCVRQYKHEKWWLPPISNEKTLKKVSKRSLLVSFRNATDEFVQRYLSWSNAEKGDFLLQIVDYCSPDEIIFLASCIYQRLENINDINNLTDDVLLRIFSYLDVDDLANVGRVSQRWRYLLSLGYIWEKKCFDLAWKHGQLDVVKNLAVSYVELDWKQLYNELKASLSIIEACESVSPPQTPVSSAEQMMSEDNTIQDNESYCSEGVSESYENGLALEISDTQIEHLVTNSELECNECKDVVVHKHVSFTSLQNEEELPATESKDDIEDVYATEEEVIETEKNAVALEKDMDKEKKDVAFDVRVRLVQPSNQVKNKVVTIPEYEAEPDYQLMQVSNIKTVSRVRKLEGHIDAVLCLQFDSKRVMTGSSDRTVRLWDIRTGRYFHKLVGHQGGVRCLKFDDKYVITGSWDTTVMIWDVIEFSLICTLTEHSDCVSCIELTSDLLITASYDTTVCIFKKHSWQLVVRLDAHTAPVSCMTLLEEKQLLTGSHDRTLLLWDMDTYCVLQKFEGLMNPCLCVKVCGSLVAAGASDGTITFWDLTNSTTEGRITAHKGPVNALCFVQSRFFSAGGDNMVREWDLSTCTCLRSLHGHSKSILCLRASSNRVVSGSVDGTARIWDMTYKLQQVGGKYDELNRSIIPTQVLNEKQFKEMTLTN